MNDLIFKFYTAFTNLDGNEMANCYHNDIIFEDPAFGILEGERAAAMWKMLCESQKGKDFKIEFSNIEASNYGGSAHWEAYYTFSKTGRKVHNKIDAQFEFKDGLIYRHQDKFNLHNWAKQAMGIKGLLFGSTGFFEKKLHNQTNSMLDKYMAEKKLSN